ncbi:MAG: ABC transporter permease, partial [Pseudomonadota bacterium]|nr:ABC transporter permease [Pseudomonadota bacterium]
MNFKLIAKRLAFLLLVIWAASTIVFFVPRLSPRNAIRERFAELARSGGFSPADIETLVANMNQQFGLDRPLLDQYWTYLGNIVRMDFGYSLNRYPSTVTDIISQALPWTFFLLLVTTVLSFIIGNLLGAVSAWPRAPRWLRNFATPFVLLTGVPP